MKFQDEKFLGVYVVKIAPYLGWLSLLAWIIGMCVWIWKGMP